MKTSGIDFLLCTVCISLLLLLAFYTDHFMAITGPYRIVLDVAVCLLSYGLYTAALLAILRRFKPYPIGDFSMESEEFIYWKLVSVLTDLAYKAFGPFTTVFTQPLIHAMFGARVGKQIAVAAIVRDHPLIHFGDYSTIGQNAVITAHAITHDRILFEPVRVGNHAVIGVNCVVMPGVTLGDHAVLASGSVAIVNTKIPAGELWGGSPARKIKNLLSID